MIGFSINTELQKIHCHNLQDKLEGKKTSKEKMKKQIEIIQENRK